MTGTVLLDRLVPGGAGAVASDSRPGAPAARAWLATHGLPDPKDEAWRYTPVDRIVARLHEIAGGVTAPGVTALDPASRAAALDSRGDGEDLATVDRAMVDRAMVDRATVDRAMVDTIAGDHGGPRLVFVDGVYTPHLSAPVRTEPGVWWGTTADLPPGRAAQAAALPSPDELARFDGFEALNRAAGQDAAVLLVDAGVVAGAPVHVVHLATADAQAQVSHPQTIVKVAEAGRVEIIETFAGIPSAGDGARPVPADETAPAGAVTNAATTIVVGPDARVTHHRVQAEARNAVHVGHTRVVQAAGSHLRSVSVMVGAAIARHALDVGLHGIGARAELDGLYVPSGDQRHDTVVTVEHAASDCSSAQRFRGVIDDEARGSFGGHIIVRADTSGTDADQSNRNLVLTRSAQADTRPWLEILADDVRCTHGATVGRLDDDALFYLRSRGIPHGEARALLVRAFVDEIVATIEPASLRDAVSALTPGGAP